MRDESSFVCGLKGYSLWVVFMGGLYGWSMGGLYGYSLRVVFRDSLYGWSLWVVYGWSLRVVYMDILYICPMCGPYLSSHIQFALFTHISFEIETFHSSSLLACICTIHQL